MNLLHYKFAFAKHHGRSVILISFDKDNKLIAELRQSFPSVKWSQTQKCWYLLDFPSIRKQLNLSLIETGKNNILKMHDINKPAFENFIRTLKLKAYSINTINVYSNEFAQFLYILKSHHVDALNSEKIKSYFFYCVEVLHLSESHLNSRMNAIKFYFEQVLHKPKVFYDIPRPKKPALLPKILNEKEIIKLFKTIENEKHLLMLKLCYGMGLRVSEIVNLKIEHIDSSRMQVLIKSGKGKKDRYVHLPQSIIPELRRYYKEYQPKSYLFEGQYGGQYAIRSIQTIFKNALKKAKIKKNIGVHGLRHSYATHLLEYGTDITYIQKLLGHNSIKTTSLYMHVSKASFSKIKSPLDRLNN